MNIHDVSGRRDPDSIRDSGERGHRCPDSGGSRNGCGRIRQTRRHQGPGSSGGRGKAGGIKLAKRLWMRNRQRCHSRYCIRGHQVNKVLVAPASISLVSSISVILIGQERRRSAHHGERPEGGVDIKEMQARRRYRSLYCNADPYLGFHPYQAGNSASNWAFPLTRSMDSRRSPQALFEGLCHRRRHARRNNPLNLTGERPLVGARRKISFDDNALFRPQPARCRDMAEENETNEAKRSGILFAAKAHGNIGHRQRLGSAAMANADWVAVKLNGGEPELSRRWRRRQCRHVAKPRRPPLSKSRPSSDFRRHYPGRCRGERYS